MRKFCKTVVKTAQISLFAITAFSMQSLASRIPAGELVGFSVPGCQELLSGLSNDIGLYLKQHQQRAFGGGFGEVYLTEKYAIKEINIRRREHTGQKALAPEEITDLTDRAQHEYRLLERLYSRPRTKDYISEPIGIYPHPERGPLIVTRAYEGSLGHKIRERAYGPFFGTHDNKDLYRQGKLHHLKILGAMEQVAKGLDAIHHEGVVHRDLNPANLLTEGDKIVFGDFGFSHSVEEFKNPETSNSIKNIQGTPVYLPPEKPVRTLAYLQQVWPWDSRAEIREPFDQAKLDDMYGAMAVSEAVIRGELPGGQQSMILPRQRFAIEKPILMITDKDFRRVSLRTPYDDVGFHHKTMIGIHPIISIFSITLFETPKQLIQMIGDAQNYIADDRPILEFFEQSYGPRFLGEMLKVNPEQAAAVVLNSKELRRLVQKSWLRWKRPSQLGLTQRQFQTLKHYMEYGLEGTYELISLLGAPCN